jgi:putative two-component system response regulator
MAALMENGVFKGYIGFDECTKQRVWTKQEIETLLFAAKIINVLLIRRELSGDPAEPQVKDGHTYKNFYIYAIDKKTFDLLYINRNLHNLMPGIRLGTRCFSAYHKYGGPCASCPALHLDGALNICTGDIKNPRLGVTNNVTACEIEWAPGRNAYFLCSYDTTQY